MKLEENEDKKIEITEEEAIALERYLKMAEKVKERYGDKSTDSVQDIALAFMYFESLGSKFDDDGNLIFDSTEVDDEH